MAKTKTLFFCQNCGHESPKWMGKCPSCNQWNTFAEEVIRKEGPVKNDWRSESSPRQRNAPHVLHEIESGREVRVATPDQELNRVLGGGIDRKSVV